MFSQWIAFIDNQNQHAAASLERHERDDQSLDGNHNVAEDSFVNHDQELEAIRVATLRQAQEVAKRMDEVMHSFPQSDDATLVQLRGNVHVWVADLSVSSQTRRSLPELFESVLTEERPVGYGHNLTGLTEQQTLELRKQQEQIRSAKHAFEKVKECIKDSLGSRSKLGFGSSGVS